METLFSLMIGVGLAAACGFRIFVPLLVMSLAAHTGHLELAGGFAWIGSTPALIAFACATLLEIAAYYVPIVDNLLDTLAVPVAVVAGIVATASQLTDVDPLLGWSLSIVAGGGTAGAVQGLTTLTRQVSALTTGGLGNPLVSTVEAGASVLMAILAIFLPLLAIVAVLALLTFVARLLMTRRRERAPQPT